jgi:hypothetical protein
MPLTGAFENSFVGLLAELWAELESVLGAAGALDDGSSGSCRRAEHRAQALRLELALLAERCDTARWHALIGSAQVDRVRSVVTAMHALLDFSPLEARTPHARRAIICVQNYLFDEVCRTRQARLQWPPRTTTVAGRASVQHIA